MLQLSLFTPCDTVLPAAVAAEPRSRDPGHPPPSPGKPKALGRRRKRRLVQRAPRARNRLTEKQLVVLVSIDEWKRAHDWAPTVRELMAYLDYQSPAAVHEHLNALADHGAIERDGTPRGIRFTAKGGELLQRFASSV